MSRLGAAVVLHVKSIRVSLYSRERSRKGWGHSASRFDRAIWPTDAEHETLVYNWRTDLRPRYLIIARSLPHTSSHDFRVSTHSIYCIPPPRKTDSTCTVKKLHSYFVPNHYEDQGGFIVIYCTALLTGGMPSQKT